ncbi:hypothetical protein Tco_0523736 [Tanacetum coccineum]
MIYGGDADVEDSDCEVRWVDEIDKLAGVKRFQLGRLWRMLFIALMSQSAEWLQLELAQYISFSLVTPVLSD